MRVVLGLAAALVSLFGARVHAQGRMPAVRPAWTVTLGSAPDIVEIDAGHVVIAADREVRRVRLADGAVVASATLPDCDSLYPASRGERHLAYDAAHHAGSNGLLVSCTGGTGNAPIHYVAAVDPVTLAIRWRVDGGARHLRAFAEHDGVVLVEASASLQPPTIDALDATTGAVRWTTRLATPGEPCDSVLQDGASVYRLACRGETVALDRRTGRVRWRTRTHALALAQLLPTRLVIATRTTTIALDATTGREVWRLDVPVQVSALERLDAGTVLIHAHAGDVLAVDVASGAVRWRAPVGAWEILARDGARIAAETRSGLVVLDAATGSVLHHAPAGDITSASWLGDAVLAVENEPPAQVQEANGAQLRLFDLGSGAGWRHPRPVATTTDALEVAGTVLACSRSGVIHAVETTTGRGRWRAFLGHTNDARGLPCELWASESDGIVLALGAAHTISAFPLGVVPRRASARILIKGEVVTAGDPANVRVLVGDVWTRTDAEGHFEVAVRGSGMITLAVHPEDAQARCAMAEDLTVPLRGAPRVRLALTPDYCACHSCD